MKRLIVLALSFHLTLVSSIADRGDVDASFDIGAGFDGVVSALAVQADGRILVGGNFRNFQGETAGRIVRLHPGGERDASFTAVLNNYLRAIVLQPDGKILIGGDFTQVNGEAHARLARLNSDGSLDPSFDPGAGPNSTIHSIHRLNDGGLLAAGAFSRFDTQNIAYLIKLDSAGAIDSSFSTPAINTTVNNVVADNGGRIWIAGSFATVDGNPSNGVARLLPDGGSDPAFQPGEGAAGRGQVIRPLDDGSALLAGEFSRYNGAIVRGVIKLTEDGLLDGEFSSGINSSALSMIRLEDGSLIVGGAFSQAGGESRTRIARLMPGGAADPFFEVEPGPNNVVNALAIDGDGHLLIGGSFTAVGGETHNRLARIELAYPQEDAVFDFSMHAYETGEGSGPAEVAVRRSGNTGSEVAVDYSLSNGTATGSDYVSDSGTLEFAAGETMRIVRVEIAVDDLLEDDETVLVTLDNPSAGAALGGLVQSAVVIVDDDIAEEAGMVDGTFHTGGTDGNVHDLHEYADGRVLVVGDFSFASGANRNRLARLNPDGSIDPSFLPSAYANRAIHALAVQPDGRILICGEFVEVNGVERLRIARLEEDGALDESFTPGSGFNGALYALELDTDGGIFAGGSFSRFNGEAFSNLIKLNSDGTRNAGFDVGEGPNNAVQAMFLQADRSLVLGGSFITVDGEPRNRIARLLPDGALDPSFHPGEGANSHVYSITSQPDGKLLVGGAFNAFNGVSARNLARLESDGLLDPTFAPPFTPALNGDVRSIWVDGEDRVSFGGNFTRIGDLPQSRVARFIGDGLMDSRFPMSEVVDQQVRVLRPAGDGAMLVGGFFTEIGQLQRRGVVRLLTNPPESAGFVDFSRRLHSTGEADGSVTVEVIRSGNTGASASVDYVTASLSADSLDYEPQSGSLQFEAGQSEATIQIPILDDDRIEPNETFEVKLLAPAGAALGVRAQTVVEILNDDDSTYAGSLVPEHIATGANGDIYDAAWTEEGKLVVVGDFSVIAGSNRNRIARFNADGSLDDSFPGHLHASRVIRTVVVDADGRIVVGGDFSVVSGVQASRIARFRSDGAPDPSFVTGDGFNGSVDEIVALDSNRLLVGGSFSRYAGESHANLVRLLPDGSIDPTFFPGAGPNGRVLAIAVAESGKIFIGGGFSMVNGIGRTRIAGLTPAGGVDPGFDPGDGPNGLVRDIALQADGGLVVGGDFSRYGSTVARYLIRVNADGSLDTSFRSDPGFNGRVYAVAIQEDGSILAGGDFTMHGTEARGKLARVGPEGRLDRSFDIGAGFDNSVFDITLGSDESAFIGGRFTALDGAPRDRFALLAVPPPPVVEGGLEIVDIERRRDDVQLLLRAPIGSFVLVESNEALSGAPWQPEHAQEVTQGLFEVILLDQSAPEKYYRLTIP